MPDPPSVSVVCTTWNRAAFLELALYAFARQTLQDFEFIVADDGSTDQTEGMVRRISSDLPYPVRYVRHDNRGFRKAATVNLGARTATGEYLFVTDCDSLPHGTLLETHLRAAAPGRLVLGECIRLTQEYTEQMDMAAVQSGDYERAWTPEEQRRLNGLQRRAQFYTWIRKRRKPRVRGNNFLLTMADYRRVNGYDERFVGWGNEDGDLRERLKRSGVRPYPIVNRAVTYHMWHPPHESKVDLANREYAWDVGARPARCEAGLDRPATVREEASPAHRT